MCFTPGGNCTDAIVHVLGDATRTIVVQACSFTSAPIAKALLEAEHAIALNKVIIIDDETVVPWAWRNAFPDTPAAFAHPKGVWYESIWHKRHTRGVLSQPSGRPVGKAGGGIIMLGRTYLMTYTDGRGQTQTERGRLVTLDQEGFVVLEVDGKHLLVPKTRIDALVEVE